MGDTAPDGTLYTIEERERFSKALSFLTKRVIHEPEAEFSVYLIRTWHSIIAKDIYKMLPGTFRTSQPTVFGSFKASSPHEVLDRLEALVKRVRRVVDSIDGYVREKSLDILDEDALNLLINESAYLHAEMVSIHPFMDGNGRISRLCQVWMLARFDVLTPPEFDDSEIYLQAINKYHESDRKDYYSLARLSAELMNVAADLAEETKQN